MEIVYKVVSDGKIVGIIVRQANKYSTILKKDMLNYRYSNAKITSDFKIRCTDDKGINEVEKKNVYLLYHGSKFGLSSIDINGCARTSDFGKGFYLNNSRENAEELISSYDTGKLYSYLLVVDNLKVYQFKNTKLWGYFISYNRKELGIDEIPKAYKDDILDIENNYDLIIGAIADDSMAEAYRLYSKRLITDVELFNCIVCLNLGQQFLIRTEKALENLLFANECRLSGELRKIRSESLVSKRKLLSSKLKDLRKRKGIKQNVKKK